MSKIRDVLNIKYVSLAIYVVLTLVSFFIFRENQLHILMLSIVISLLPGLIITLKKNILFIGSCVLTSSFLFLSLSYLASDYKSVLTFSFFIADYFLLFLFNWLSIKWNSRELNIINLSFITENSSLLDIIYFVLKFTLIIVWTYINLV